MMKLPLPPDGGAETAHAPNVTTPPDGLDTVHEVSVGVVKLANVNMISVPIGPKVGVRVRVPVTP